MCFNLNLSHQLWNWVFFSCLEIINYALKFWLYILHSPFLSFGFLPQIWSLRECEIWRQLFRYLGKAYLQMKGRIRYSMLPNVFSVNGVFRVHGPTIPSNPQCVQMGNDPAESPISYWCFSFHGVTTRLFGLDVDMEPEIGKREAMSNMWMLPKKNTFTVNGQWYRPIFFFSGFSRGCINIYFNW